MKWLITAVLLSACTANTELPEITSAMSPCQCRLQGGCMVSWKPRRSIDLYADGTHPREYNERGTYVGNKPMESICRGNFNQ